MSRDTIIMTFWESQYFDVGLSKFRDNGNIASIVSVIKRLQFRSLPFFLRAAVPARVPAAGEKRLKRCDSPFGQGRQFCCSGCLLLIANHTSEEAIHLFKELLNLQVFARLLADLPSLWLILCLLPLRDAVPGDVQRRSADVPPVTQGTMWHVGHYVTRRALCDTQGWAMAATSRLQP